MVSTARANQQIYVSLSAHEIDLDDVTCKQKVASATRANYRFRSQGGDGGESTGGVGLGACVVWVDMVKIEWWFGVACCVLMLLNLTSHPRIVTSSKLKCCLA